MAKKKMMQEFDFSNTRTFVKVPEGRYNAKVKDVEEKDFASGNSGFTVQFEMLTGIGKGGVVYDNYPIMEQSLWKIKQLLECLGFKVPDKLKIDLMTLVGKKCTLDIVVEEYNGKDIPKVEKMYPLEILDDEDDEEDEDEYEEPKPKKSKKSKSKKQAKPEPDDEPEDTEDESFDEDEEEIDDDVEEVDAEELPDFEDDEDDEDNPFLDDDEDWDDEDED